MIAMLIVDSLLISGVKFVLKRIAEAAEAELNDEGALREELLAAQMRLELGEISTSDFRELERALLERLREIRERTRAPQPKVGTGAQVEIVMEPDHGPK